MATLEPEDEFDALMASQNGGEGFDFGELDEQEAVDYTKMDTMAIESMLEEVKDKLYERGEMLAQTTDEGMDLNNIYVALIAEKQRRRGLR